MAGSFEGEDAKAHVKLTGQRADVTEACDLQQALEPPKRTTQVEPRIERRA